MKDLSPFIPMITEWQNLLMRGGGLERNCHAPLLEAALSKPIKIITGFRRSGKSFLVQMIAHALVQQKKYPIENILYLNF